MLQNLSEEVLRARTGRGVAAPARACGLGYDYDTLLGAAADPGDPVTLAFAGVVSMAAGRRPPYDVPVAGLDDAELAALERHCFPRLVVPLSAASYPLPAEARFDEFADLVALLLDHRTRMDDVSCWLAHAVATACMGDNHLWQDMGLPSRAVLSVLMQTHFGSLARLNDRDMKWKKFFYRQLCEQEGLRVCRAPSCGVCSDYASCFGPEDSD